MEKKMTEEEYKNHIEKLKKENGVVTVSCKRDYEEEQRVLEEWFPKGTVLTTLSGKKRVV